MNIINAIKGMTDGQAVKPSNWRGYVKRTDMPSSTYTEYDPDRTTSYPAGTSVLFNSNRYINEAAVNPASDTGKVGPFDSSKWTRVSFDYLITFIDADDSQPTPNPSAVYRASVTLAGVTFERTSPASPVDMPDSELFTAILAETWETASVADYEQQRAGGDHRW